MTATNALIRTKLIAGGRFELFQQIGNGSFGVIYLGKDVASGEHVAVKVESVDAKIPQLLYESKIYHRLLNKQRGFPQVRWFGNEGRNIYLVMDLLGPSLEELYHLCSRKFSLKTVLMLFDQMINRLELLHSKFLIHRDIKPDNFLMGMNKCSYIVFLVDLGLARKYRSFSTHAHIAKTENHCLTGTARYASLNAHKGIQQSRRDDLESLGYVLVYFLKGGLPWQGSNGTNKIQNYEKMYEKKMSTPLHHLCEGLPREFEIYLNYCRTLLFNERPEYDYLRRLFRNLFDQLKYENDYKYDWTELSYVKNGNDWVALKKDMNEAKG